MISVAAGRDFEKRKKKNMQTKSCDLHKPNMYTAILAEVGADDAYLAKSRAAKALPAPKDQRATCLMKPA